MDLLLSASYYRSSPFRVSNGPCPMTPNPQDRARRPRQRGEVDPLQPHLRTAQGDHGRPPRLDPRPQLRPGHLAGARLRADRHRRPAPRHGRSAPGPGRGAGEARDRGGRRRAARRGRARRAASGRHRDRPRAAARRQARRGGGEQGRRRRTTGSRSSRPSASTACWPSRPSTARAWATSSTPRSRGCRGSRGRGGGAAPAARPRGPAQRGEVVDPEPAAGERAGGGLADPGHDAGHRRQPASSGTAVASSSSTPPACGACGS